MANPQVEKIKALFKQYADKEKLRAYYTKVTETAKMKYLEYRTSPQFQDWRPGTKKGNIRVAGIATGALALLIAPFLLMRGSRNDDATSRLPLPRAEQTRRIRPAPENVNRPLRAPAPQAPTRVVEKPAKAPVKAVAKTKPKVKAKPAEPAKTTKQAKKKTATTTKTAKAKSKTPARKPASSKEKTKKKKATKKTAS